MSISQYAISEVAIGETEQFLTTGFSFIGLLEDIGLELNMTATTVMRVSATLGNVVGSMGVTSDIEFSIATSLSDVVLDSNWTVETVYSLLSFVQTLEALQGSVTLLSEPLWFCEPELTLGVSELLFKADARLSVLQTLEGLTLSGTVVDTYQVDARHPGVLAVPVNGEWARAFDADEEFDYIFDWSLDMDGLGDLLENAAVLLSEEAEEAKLEVFQNNLDKFSKRHQIFIRSSNAEVTRGWAGRSVGITSEVYTRDGRNMQHTGYLPITER